MLNSKRLLCVRQGTRCLHIELTFLLISQHPYKVGINVPNSLVKKMEFRKVIK